jgi:hypothetical protein
MMQKTFITGFLVIAIAAMLGCGGLFEPQGPKIPTQAYYTVDDGQTWFADDIKNIPPYEVDGKQAVRVYLYRCNGGKPFVGHLERYTPEAKAAAEEFRKSFARSRQNPVPLEMEFQGREVKKPGGTEWVSLGNMREAEKIITPRCPPGQQLEVVMPE